MSPSKHRYTKKIKSPTQGLSEMQRNKPESLSIRKLVRKILGYIFVFFSALSLYYSFQSKINIYTVDIIDPKQVFQTPFVIENQSLLPIYDINYSFNLNRMNLF